MTTFAFLLELTCYSPKRRRPVMLCPAILLHLLYKKMSRSASREQHPLLEVPMCGTRRRFRKRTPATPKFFNLKRCRTLKQRPALLHYILDICHHKRQLSHHCCLGLSGLYKNWDGACVDLWKFCPCVDARLFSQISICCFLLYCNFVEYMTIYLNTLCVI